MKRLLGVLAFGLILATVARADLIPPDTKNIAINHQIETEKDYPDWQFFVVAGSGGIKEVKLDAKNPLTVAGSNGIGNGPAPDPAEKRKALQLAYRSNLLIAIPKETVKKFPTEKELHAVIWDLKVEGLARVKDTFYDHANVKITDPRKSVTRAFRVTKIDAKDGIVLEAGKDIGKPEPEEEEGPLAGVFPWVAGGLAVATLVGFAGLWVSRRSRAS
jgi:hypothetical protein